MNQASDLDGLGNLRKLAEKFANANLPEDKEIPIVMGECQDVICSRPTLTFK